MHKLLAVALLLAGTMSVKAQQGVEQVLASVTDNNKTIKAAGQYVTAKGIEYRTGIAPDNPFVSADYMIGRPVSGGNQFDFMATQSLDFPTVYFKKGALADEQTMLLDIEYRQLRQEVLLEAKKLCFEIIHLNRYKAVLQQRGSTSEAIVADYQEQYELKQISALELNKAKMQLLGIQSELRSVESNIKVKTEQLTTLNGGNPIALTDTAYPETTTLPAPETLQDTIAALDPMLQWYQQQTSVLNAEVAVNKADAFPKLEAGYHHQSVLGQTFNGVHLGMSVPLWQHKNKVKASKAMVELNQLQLTDNQTERHYEIAQLYEQYQNLQQTITSYREVLSGLNSEVLLKQMLDLGEINFITYGMEIEYYYKYSDQLLQLEKDYQLVMAELLKYKL